jgi:hypothetical protein
MTKAPKGWEKIEPSGRKRPARTGKRSSPPGKRRLRVKAASEKRIVEIIEDWNEPGITWKALVQVVNTEFEGDWSPQALMKHPRLKAAYKLKKDELQKKAKKGGSGRPAKQGDGTLKVLQRQIRDMREEIAGLRSDKARLLEQFATWKTNAYLNGWSIKALDKKLEKPDRGQTDKKR